MRFLYFTDPHGKRSDYWNTLRFAIESNTKIIVCGGDLFPKFAISCSKMYEIQKRFILTFLPQFLLECHKNNIKFITVLGNDDLRALDPIFNKICRDFKICHNTSRSKAVLNDWEFIGFDLVRDLFQTSHIHLKKYNMIITLANFRSKFC